MHSSMKKKQMQQKIAWLVVVTGSSVSRERHPANSNIHSPPLDPSPQSTSTIPPSQPQTQSTHPPALNNSNRGGGAFRKRAAASFSCKPLRFRLRPPARRRARLNSKTPTQRLSLSISPRPPPPPDPARAAGDEPRGIRGAGGVVGRAEMAANGRASVRPVERHGAPPRPAGRSRSVAPPSRRPSPSPSRAHPAAADNDGGSGTRSSAAPRTRESSEIALHHRCIGGFSLLVLFVGGRPVNDAFPLFEEPWKRVSGFSLFVGLSGNSKRYGYLQRRREYHCRWRDDHLCISALEIRYQLYIVLIKSHTHEYKSYMFAHTCIQVIYVRYQLYIRSEFTPFPWCC